MTAEVTQAASLVADQVVRVVAFEQLAEAFEQARVRPGAQTNFDLPPEPWWVGGPAGITCVSAITPANRSVAVEAAARGANLVVAIADEAWAWPIIRDLSRFGRIIVGFDAPESRPIQLNDDQLDLLRLLADGRSIPDAARELFLSMRTAERRVGAARRALGVQTTAEAILMIGAGS